MQGTFLCLRVGLSLLTLFPGRVGGSESYARALLREYAAGRGPEEVVALANRHVMAAYEPQGGAVELLEVRSYRPGDSAPTRAAAMAWAALRPRAAARDVPGGLDVLHHPFTVPIPSLPVPTVTTLHDVHHHELPDAFGRAERLYRRWAYDAAARRADVVIVPSEHTALLARERLGVRPEALHVIPWGIDHGRFRPQGGGEAVRARFGLPERFLLYPANLWPHKNHERLVQALARLDGDLVLALTGQDYGRLGALMAAARRAGVADRVRHLGYVDHDDVPALLATAAVMVFPSLTEGFGSPPLEAMACGTPVVAARAGALPEVCGDAAVLVDPHSPEDIAAGIDRALADREALAAAGLRRAAGFTWGGAAAGHVDAYRAALGSSSASSAT